MSTTLQTSARPVLPTYGEWIDCAVQGPHDDIRDSTLGHQESINELLDVWEDCKMPGWDGYGALAVDPATITTTYLILNSLPVGFPRPSVGAQPDGLVTLEWYRSPTRTLSVSIDPNGFIHYAGLFGNEEHCGTVQNLGELSENLKRMVLEV